MTLAYLVIFWDDFLPFLIFSSFFNQVKSGKVSPSSSEDLSSSFTFTSTSGLSSVTLEQGWHALTSKELWGALNGEMKAYYNFDMNLDNLVSIQGDPHELAHA